MPAPVVLVKSSLSGRNGHKKHQQQQARIKLSHVILVMIGLVLLGTLAMLKQSLQYIHTSSSSHKSSTTHHEMPSKAKLPNKDIIPMENNQQQDTQRQLPEIDIPKVQQTLQKIKQQFYERYGGKDTAEKLLAKTITTFGDVDNVAKMILQSILSRKEFVMGFAGYSITVGRGNYFQQSFPFVLEGVLKDAFDALPIPLVVRNAAIGGIPSFPYAFCFDHFVSSQTQVLSWDFSMNEQAKDPAVFEAYLRQALHQLDTNPMIIMVDANSQRANILKHYTFQKLLPNAMTVSKAEAVINQVDSTLLTKDEASRPPGFQKWDQFGAPDQCPGKGSWHPKRQEHAYMGWMMAMYFVQALERLCDLWSSANVVELQKLELSPKKQDEVVFGKPLSNPPPNNDDAVTQLLFGHPTDDNTHQQYHMNPLSCRTNFLPATDTDKTLQSLVMKGLSPTATVDNIMDPRSDSIYREGWVLDVSSVERDTKRKVETCGGLGYIDMKIALYGIPESGPLELLLPHENVAPLHDDHHHDFDVASHKDAQHWFNSLVIICEANDKRPKEACQLDQDVTYTVGGVVASDIKWIHGAAEYLKRQTCVAVRIPDGATITHKETIGETGSVEDQVGLSVTIQAKPRVTRKAGACCISHVVWEQQ